MGGRPVWMDGRSPGAGMTVLRPIRLLAYARPLFPRSLLIFLSLIAVRKLFDRSLTATFLIKCAVGPIRCFTVITFQPFNNEQ